MTAPCSWRGRAALSRPAKALATGSIDLAALRPAMGSPGRGRPLLNGLIALAAILFLAGVVYATAVVADRTLSPAHAASSSGDPVQ